MQVAKTSLELTLKAIIIGVILAILLCGANLYLGLKIGTTISASIPASIISLGILRMFKKYSILENNISQTIASSGEALAGVIIFVFPALLILGVWKEFKYLDLLFLGLCGGFIGIAYSVLLRRVLLKDPTLPFPEGNAIGQVLLATNNTKDKSGFKTILGAIGVAALINLCQNGFKIFADSYYKFFKVNNSVIGLGTSFSPAVIGAGFLIGGNAVIAFVGLLLGWLVLLPYFANIHGLKDSSDLVGSAFLTWKTYVRPVGIGVFLFSGVATILMMTGSIVTAIKESVHALRNINEVNPSDRDLNIKKLLALVVVCIIPVGVFIYFKIAELGVCSPEMSIVYALLLSVLVLILGFIIAAVAGYMVGMVGSSNSPLSGLYFIAVILISLVIKGIADGHLNVQMNSLMAIVVLLVGFIGFSAVITNENIQDYKSGQLVGATPYKQQLSLFIGVVFAMAVAPLLINLVFNAYGIAGVVPHPGIDPNNTLSAPQASAIAMITKNVLHGSQDWSLMGLGILIGAVAFTIDQIGKRSGKFRTPAIMLGMGLYLPPDLVTGLFVGGLLSVFIKRRQRRLVAEHGAETVEKLDNKTNVLICGLIAGESLMGLVLAIPFVIKQSSDALRLVGDGFAPIAQVLSLIVTVLLIRHVYRTATKIKSAK